MEMLLVLASILAVILLASCGEDATNTPQRTTIAANPTNTLPAPTVGSAGISPLVAQETDVTSDIVNFALEDLVIQAGTTVTWVQQDSSPHIWTSDQSQGEDRLKQW